jgi:hypothetical protein
VADQFGWGEFQDSMWDRTFGEEFQDGHAEALFHAAYFAPGQYTSDELQAIRDELKEYLGETYDFDINAHFDWEAFREGYSEL